MSCQRRTLPFWVIALASMLALAVSAGCSADTSSTASPTPLPSYAALMPRTYAAQGFALRLPANWASRVDPSGTWDLTAYPRGAAANFPGLSVVVEASSHPPNLSTYDGKLARQVSQADVHHSFQAATVNGMPALVAAYRRAFADGSEPLELEWYVLSAGPNIYSISIGAPRDQWPTWAPRLRQLVDTFTVGSGT